MSRQSPIPSDVPFVALVRDPETQRSSLTGFMSEDFSGWLLEQQTRLNVSPERLGVVSLTNRNISLGVTAIPTATLTAGIYRVSTFMRVTTVGTVSSSLQVTITFTTGTVVSTLSGAALTTNLTTSVQANTWLLKIDNASPVSYSTTYASDAAAQMRYDLVVILEAINT